MKLSCSSLPRTLAIAASAGMVLTGCGASELATAIPSTTGATLITSADSASIAADSDLPPILEALDLTEEQQQQAEQIRLASREQIRGLLTAEQIAVLDSFAGEDREAFRTLRQELNLTQQQQDQIAEILTISRQQLETLLTPEQLVALEEAVTSVQGLDLSAQQLQQIEQIRQDHRAEIRALLTPEQITLLDSFQGQDRDAFKALSTQLNLSEAQKDEIAAIMGDSREQIRTLLNAEQLDTLEGFKEGLGRIRARRSRLFNG